MPTFRLGSANQSVIIISRNADNSIKVKSLPFLLYVELSFSRGWALIAKKLKRRDAVEPVIGHMKADGRLGRNFLKARRVMP